MINLSFLKEKLDQIVFFELMKDIELKNGFILDKKFPIPLLLESVKDKIYDSNPVFSQSEMTDGIIFLLGLDPKFKYLAYYKELLLGIDENILEILSAEILNEITLENRLDSLVKIVGIHHLGLDDENLMINIGRLSNDIYIENENEEFNNLSRRIFEYLLEKNVFSPLPEYYLGYFYYNKGMYSKAKSLWENSFDKGLEENQQLELIEIFPKLKSKIIYEEGYELILKERYDEGLEKLLSVKDEFSEWWNIYFFIGLGYRFKEDYRSAIHYFNRALEINDDNVDTMNEIGICYTMLGEYEKAIEIYSNSIVLNPENHETICNLGIVYYNKGDLKLASKFIQKAYEIAPDDEVTKIWIEYLNKSSH
ncbi:MAG: tetratricopeptide repeat protein [Clostridiales bacterium]|nr:tetratricopeptide repeat protein [Clostridiales bacterium]